jgi:hypothetical protein
MNNPDQALKSQAHCRFLRSKEMYYQADRREDDPFSSGLYWCMQTHETFGPDGQPVGKQDCCAGRGCFGG